MMHLCESVNKWEMSLHLPKSPKSVSHTVNPYDVENVKIR